MFTEAFGTFTVTKHQKKKIFIATCQSSQIYLKVALEIKLNLFLRRKHVPALLIDKIK